MFNLIHWQRFEITNLMGVKIQHLCFGVKLRIRNWNPNSQKWIVCKLFISIPTLYRVKKTVIDKSPLFGPYILFIVFTVFTLLSFFDGFSTVFLHCFTLLSFFDGFSTVFRRFFYTVLRFYRFLCANIVRAYCTGMDRGST